MSTTDGIRGLSGSLLSLGVITIYDILLVSLGQGLGQLAPICCHFLGFPSI